MKHNLTKELLDFVILNFSLTIYAYMYTLKLLKVKRTINNNDDDVNDA